jgi:hypothetical protein
MARRRVPTGDASQRGQVMRALVLEEFGVPSLCKGVAFPRSDPNEALVRMRNVVAM